MFGSGVSQRVDDFGLFKAGSTEFFQECTCILCTGDSREPVGAAGLEAFGQCRLKNQLRAKDLPARADPRLTPRKIPSRNGLRLKIPLTSATSILESRKGNSSADARTNATWRWRRY